MAVIKVATTLLERAVDLVQPRFVTIDNMITVEDLVNLDGIVPDWSVLAKKWRHPERYVIDLKLNRLNDIAFGNTGFIPYPVLIHLRGEFGASELGMHMGMVSNIGIIALTTIKDHLCYAHILFDNGTITDGSFHLFENGTFSLS